MLSPQQIQHYRDHGYVLGSKVLDDAQIQTLCQELKRVIERRDDDATPDPVQLSNMGTDQAPIWQIVNIYFASQAFRDLVAFNPQVIEAAAQLAGDSEQLRIWHDQIQYKPADTGGVNMWHQDSPLWPTLTPRHEQVTAWIALDDVAEDNGCMSMVPGSHTWGDVMDSDLRLVRDFDQLPTDFHGRPVERRLCPVKKGYVHFHHPLTWHGSHQNRSGRPRRAIAVHFMTGRTNYAGPSQHPMEAYVSVAPGQRLEGAGFPLVYDRGKVLGSDAAALA